MDIIKDKLSNFTNSESFKTSISSIVTILLGIFIGFILMLFLNPANAFDGLKIILTHGFSDLEKVFRFSTPIIFTGLSVAFAFRTGLFNIGATGQFTIGAAFAIYVGVNWTFLPYPIHWIVAFLVGGLFGFLWGIIPGLLKAYRNVHEVVATIMMNYIAMYFVVYFVKTDKMFNSLRGETLKVPATAKNMHFGLFDIAFVLAIITAIICFIFLFKTRRGYELRAVGSNKHAAHYAGIDEKKSITFSMGIAGLLAGLGGALLYLSLSNIHLEPQKVLLPQGFDGISVALIASSHPIGVIFSGIFVGFLKTGGEQLQTVDFSLEIVDLIVATIIYFIAFSTLFKKALFNRKKSVSVVTMDDEQLAIVNKADEIQHKVKQQGREL